MVNWISLKVSTQQARTLSQLILILDARSPTLEDSLEPLLHRTVMLMHLIKQQMLVAPSILRTLRLTATASMEMVVAFLQLNGRVKQSPSTSFHVALFQTTSAVATRIQKTGVCLMLNSKVVATLMSTFKTNKSCSI